MNDKTTELKDRLVPRESAPSKFGIKKEQLLEIVNMDNRPKHGSEGAAPAAKIIMEQLGGPEGVAKLLQTNTQTGILFNDQERIDRVNAFGANSFLPPKIKTLCELIMENFEDEINRILLGASVVSLIIGGIQHGFPEGLLEGVSIMIALCIIIVVGSGNNYASEKRLAKLVAMADKQNVPVYRKGKKDQTETISYEDLVVGDLIELSKGNKVPADLMCVQADNLKSAEDALTGEPDALVKEPLTQENYTMGTDCILFAKATITEGNGKAIVIAVGEDTEAGKIQKKVQETSEEEDNQTLLQHKLNSIANQIGNVGYACAALTFIAILIRLNLELMGVINCGCKNLVTCEAPEKDANGVIQGCEELNPFNSGSNRFFTELLNTIIIAITVIVVAIPEGLPLAVTISLSFSSAKLQKAHNLVRKLASAETMGAVTHICSDKTGTLTENKMTTMAVYSYQKNFGITKKSELKQLATNIQSGIGPKGWELLSECAIWNSEARIEEFKEEDGEEGYTGVDKPKWAYHGNVTDQGILKMFAEVMGIEETREKKLSLTEDDIVTQIPFESRNKRSLIAVKKPNDMVRVYVKGAPDVLYEKKKDIVAGIMTAKYSNLKANEAQARAEKDAGNGMVGYVAVAGGKEKWQGPASPNESKSLKEILDIQGRSGQNPDHEDIFQATVKDFACQAYRTILCCYKDMTQSEFEDLRKNNNDFKSLEDREVLYTDLIAIGLFGIQDPLRDTIIDSIKDLRTAQIQVIMCTGDNIDTATAISKNAGIIQEGDEDHEYTRLEGKTFRALVGKTKKVPDPENPKKKKEVLANQFQFNQVIKHLKVLARSSPQDKYLLVTGLQNTPYVAEGDMEENDNEAGKESSNRNYCSVAVTGDGTNDAPALAKSDVGFSMGITGTDIAKGASDIILLKDNFSHIITALRYGRNIYDNVRKFLQFQLTVNVVAMFIVFFGSVMLSDSPLTAVQMLWVNLIMDTLAALALATEPPDDDILTRPPQPSSKSIVTEIMWRNVHGHAIYQMIVLIVIIFAAQGSLVHNYDVKCLVTREDGKACPLHGLNPYFAADHYFEGETKSYWTNLDSELSKEEAFEPVSWATYQCERLRGDFPDQLSVLEAKQNVPCTKGKNYKTFLNGLQAEFQKAEFKGETKLGGAKGSQFYLPQKTEAGTGTEKLLHMTYVFQIFVFMQIFNQTNARLLTGNFNIFEGIHKNWLFGVVSISTFIIQMLMVEVGGKVTKTYPLAMWQNGICLAFGAGELIWGVLIKFLPLKFFQCIAFDEKPMTEEEHEKSTINRFKRGSTKKPKNKVEELVGDALLAKINAKYAEQTQGETNE